MDFSNNRISGTLPSEIQSLLVEVTQSPSWWHGQLSLHGNNLTGDFDPLFCNHEQIRNWSFPFVFTELSADCADTPMQQQTAPIKCTCCTQCHRQDGKYWERCLGGEVKEEDDSWCVECGFNRTQTECFMCTSHFFFRDGLIYDNDIENYHNGTEENYIVTYESVCESASCMWDYVTGSCIERQ